MAKKENLYKKALTLSKRSGEEFMELAEAMYQLKSEDPDRYRDFLTVSDMDGRKAQYLIAIYETFAPLNIPAKIMSELKWTKAMALQPYINKDNAQELIAYAQNHKVADIKAFLKKGAVSDPQIEKSNAHAVTMYFSPEDYGKLFSVLLANGAQRSGRGLVDKEKALINLIDTLPKK